MSLGDSSSGGSGGKDPLRYPIARNRFATMWVSEGDDGGFYFNIKLDVPFIGEETVNLSATNRAEEFVQQVGESWKQAAEEAGE